MALAALEHGSDYLQQAIADLAYNRQVIAEALAPLGSQGHGWVGGEGAIYFWAKLPERFSTWPSGCVAAAAATGGRPTAVRLAAAAAAAGVVDDNGAGDENHVGNTASHHLADTHQGTEPAAAAAAAGTDEDVVAWLIREHGVCVVPGSACGTPGYIRVAYANVTQEQCSEAAARLKMGLQQLLGLNSVLQQQQV
jgi:aspartate/methionine/tyrosine aminotransferase